MRFTTINAARSTSSRYSAFRGGLCLSLLVVLFAGLSSIPATTHVPAIAAGSFSRLALSVPADAGYTPAQIQTAYNVAPLLQSGINGTGQTMALIELDSFAPSDLQQFNDATGLPQSTVAQYYVGGQSFALPSAGEATLDLEWAHALAPAARLQVYYIHASQVNAGAWRSIGQAVRMAVANGANTISMSFGTCGPTSGYSATAQALAAARSHGVSVFVSSGDTGARAGSIRECGSGYGVGYPASDPNVVAVGGTSLQLADDNTIADEVAWRLSGGGKAKPLARPLWQIAPTLGLGKYRYVPDVSFLGDPRTGAAIFYKGQWVQGGGTSLGAPAWAALWTLIVQDAARAGKTLGAAPSLIYRLGNSSARSGAFHDVVQGNNGRYQAAPGWDAVTGWGTPNVGGLAAAVQALSP